MNKTKTVYVVVNETVTQSILKDLFTLFTLVFGMAMSTVFNLIIWQLFILVGTIWVLAGYLMIRNSSDYKRFTNPDEAIKFLESAKEENEHGI